MEHYPNRSAQEAALSAVNLAPVASPSDESPAPEPSEAEALTRSHGLLILERTPDGVPSWLACKFCPIFGCNNKRKQYLKLYRIPDQFSAKRVDCHLKREHTEKWEDFKLLDEQKKKEFFHGKTLPSPQQFRKRMDELQQCWGPSQRKRATKRLRSSDSFAESLQRSARRIKTDTNTNLSVLRTLSLPSHQEDWIGRTAFESAATQSAQPANGQLLHKPDITTKCIPRRHATLPGKKLYKHLRAILQRYSEPFSHDLQQALNQPVVESEMQEDSFIPTWKDVQKADFAARVLFYLLRGVPDDVAATLLEESNSDSRKQDKNSLEKPVTRKMVHPDLPEKNDAEDGTANQMGVSTAASTQQLEAPGRAKNNDAPQTSEVVEALSSIPNWKKFVRTTANAVSIASMLALTRILSNRQGWAFVIITRPCLVRKDAVEVLIPLPRASSAPNSVTLIAPSPRAVPVNDVEDHAMGSSADPSGAGLGNTMDLQQSPQVHMKKQATDVISHIFSHCLVSNGTRNMPPDCGKEGMNEWVQERIKMCLMQALIFLIESGGISKARERLKANVRCKPFCKDWILTTPIDAASINAARVNYSKCGHGLKHYEWQFEKQVIIGLVTCYQKALAFTRITSFSSTLIYAEAVLRKAITNFDMFLPVTRTIPRVPVEPLHLVSVREGNHAVETVIGLLDLVHPQWPSRLIGVRSEISNGAAGKPLEEALVNALQERRGRELVVVDESIPEDERPIYPSNLAKMAQDEFRKFVDCYIKERAIFEDRFIQNLLNQHEVLCLKEVANGLNKSWKDYEDMTQLITFVQGLKLLWNREPDSGRLKECRVAGLVYDDNDNCQVVDCNVEHVFNARTLMEIEQAEKLDGEGGRPQDGDVGLKDYLIRWGENWSNLLTGKAG